MLVRRSAIEAIGGWDEGFFLYGEDIDLCRRLWEGGYRVRYEASATATHIGGASAPRGRSIPFLARGRIRFAQSTCGHGVALLHQTGIALGALTHAVFTTQGRGSQGRADPSVEGGDLLRRDADPHSLTACGDPNGGWSGRTITSNVWRGPCAVSAE